MLQNKYHMYIATAISLAFLVILQQFPSDRPLFRFLALTICAYLVLLLVYTRWYLKKMGKYSVWTWLVPALFYATAFSLYAIIPWYFVKGLFLILTFVLGIIFLLFLGSFSENIMLNQSLVIGFGVFMSLSAYNFYFPTFQNLYLIGVFIASLVVTRAYFDVVPKTSRFKLVTALAISLFMVELYWALMFLPLHYSVTGLLLFNAYYFFIVLTFNSLFNTLNAKKLAFHLWLLGLSSAAILVVTPWKIIS